jgi:predicted nucleotide-binding protein
MDETRISFAKLAGIKKAVESVLAVSSGVAGRSIRSFSPSGVAHYFIGALGQLAVLKDRLPELYGDFPTISAEPSVEMQPPHPAHYARSQVEALLRALDQIFEIRSNSELAAPIEKEAPSPRVFISHGREPDWREVQSFIERDANIATLELAQEPNLGRTVLQKLEQESSKCTSAVIVMTGEDHDAEGNLRTRENILHEIGYFQSKFGLSAVCLLHEEGTSIPSNIHGLVYIPFPKGLVSATFGALLRELKSLYR